MSKSLPKLAKLTRPRLHSAVPRDRLFALLEARTRESRVVWISGPPGAGKTTLVAGYLESRKLPSLWYQLDRGDIDVSAFFHYLSLAAQQLNPRKLSLPTPSSEVMSDPITFGRGFFRELFSRAPKRFLLVLDNYQEVPDSAVLHTVLRDAIEEIPDSIHFVVLSRALPPNPFARHRAHGAIAQIGFAELKLTADEAVTIARQRNMVDLGAVGSIHSRSDGWFAGFTLLLEHATKGKPITASSEGESLEAVFQYFAGEIFDAASPEQQQTLMQTAFLPVMTAKTAERISANPNAYKILDWLHQRQLFVERRPGEVVTYQYHALFREFLLSRVREIFTPLGLRQLARRAADLLQESGLPEEAVNLLLESEDWPPAKQAILALAPRLFSSAKWTTLGLWISKLPAAEVEDDGWLQFWQGMTNCAQQPLLAQEQLGLAYASFERAGDRLGQVLSCSGVIRAYHSNIHGEFPTINVWIQRLIGLLQEHSSVLEVSQSLDVYASLLTAFQYHEPANPYREQCSARLVELLEDSTIGLEHKGFAGGMALRRSAHRNTKSRRRHTASARKADT